jgi:sodium transport system permease protein
LLRAFNREAATLRMVARGVSPDLVEPVRVQRVNTATTRQRGTPLFLFITMFATFAPLMGGLAVAIDSTAGERERGSLEPLLANPIRISHLVAGKWLAAWTFGAAAGLLALGGVVLAAGQFADSRIAAILVFGAPELARFMALVVPFAAMCAALQMLICTYGRTYREAQTYVSYFTALVGAVPIVFILAAPQGAAWQLAVPVLGQQVVFNRLARGDAASAIDYLLPSAVALCIAAVGVALVSRLLRDERIVFGRS